MRIVLPHNNDVATALFPRPRTLCLTISTDDWLLSNNYTVQTRCLWHTILRGRERYWIREKWISATHTPLHSYIGEYSNWWGFLSSSTTAPHLLTTHVHSYYAQWPWTKLATDCHQANWPQATNNTMCCPAPPLYLVIIVTWLSRGCRSLMPLGLTKSKWQVHVS